MLPMLMVILAGVLDLGRMYYAYISVVNSAREGARFGATHPPTGLPCNTNSDHIKLRTQNEAQSSGIDPGMLTITVDCPDTSDPPKANTFGHPVKVDVSYNFYPILTRMLGLGTIRLRSDTQMQIYAH